jgi:hypothetical protein
VTAHAPEARHLPQLAMARAGFVAIGVAFAGVFAHGCHGADEDHEPAVASPVEHRRGVE